MLCRACDRGNIYCSAECSLFRRKEYQRCASQRYQLSREGRLKHAARAASYRARKKQIVTQQGSHDRVEHVSLVVETEVEILDKQESEQQIAEEAELAVEPAADDTSYMVRCYGCSRWCGPFARQEPWQGGRYFKRKRRTSGNFKGNRGRDSPTVLR